MEGGEGRPRSNGVAAVGSSSSSSSSVGAVEFLLQLFLERYLLLYLCFDLFKEKQKEEKEKEWIAAKGPLHSSESTAAPAAAAALPEVKGLGFRA